MSTNGAEIVPMEPEGYDLPATLGSPDWINPQTTPQVYADLFVPPEVDRRSNPFGDRDRVVELVTAVLADIAVRGDTENKYAKAPVPICTDLSVIQSALDELPNTPIAFASDGFAATRIQNYWNRFRDGSIQAFRETQGIARSNMVSIDLALPDGLDATNFDPLDSAVALRAKISQKHIVTTLGTAVASCDITIDGNVGPEAHIGDRSHHSRFTIRGTTFYAKSSFHDSHDIIVAFGNTRTNAKIGKIAGKSIVSKSSADGTGKLTIVGNSFFVKTTGSNIQLVEN